MKVICSKDDLLEGINIVQKAVTSKSTLPILEGILIEANDNLKLTGNDLETGIECEVAADIREKGSIVINSKIMGEIVRKLPDAEVFIEVRDNYTITIECENAFFEMRGMSGEGYPSLPYIERKKGIKLKQGFFKEMIRQVVFSVGTDENRPVLTGVLFEYKSGVLSLVAIDGYRMALRKTEFGLVEISGDDQGENHAEGGLTERKPKEEDFSFVIPGKAMNELARIIQRTEDDLMIYPVNNQILFDLGNCIVTSRLLEGEYLNYEGIIPKEYETRIKANVKDLMACFERASLMVTVDDRKYPVKVTINDDLMVISAKTETGTTREEMRLEVEGRNLGIFFNPRYFIEVLRVIENEQVNVYFTTEMGPSIIRPLDGDYFTYLILPVKG